MWLGVKVLIIDSHGWPQKTVDLRWTVSGTSGSKDEVSGHKRNVPVDQLTDILDLKRLGTHV